MTTYAYRWPSKLCIMQERWNHVQPTNTSASLLTGKQYRLLHDRERIDAMLTIDGAVYCGECRSSLKMQAIRRALLGGRHYVILSYTPFGLADGIAPYTVALDGRFQQAELPWNDGGTDQPWNDAQIDRNWASGIKPGAPVTMLASGATTFSVSHHVAGSTLACAGSFVQIDGSTYQLLSDVVVDSGGAATAYFYPALPADTQIDRFEANQPEEGLFDVVTMPKGDRDWTRSNQAEPWRWEFRQVFADEIGAYTERDIW